MKLSRHDDKLDKLFNVIVNDVQVLTNGISAEVAIANAKTWVEVEGREAFKYQFHKRGHPCDCDCEDEGECTCESKTKKLERLPVTISNVISNDNHQNLSYFNAVYIVTSKAAAKKAKRGRPARK